LGIGSESAVFAPADAIDDVHAAAALTTTPALLPLGTPRLEIA
jgi:hypothetical protein